MQASAISMQNLLREFTFILFYRKKMIIYTTFLVFALAVFLAIVLPPVYESSAKFFINISEGLDPLQKEQFYSLKEQMVRLMQNQKELIFSNNVLKTTIEKLHPTMSDADKTKAIEDIKPNIVVSPPEGESFEGTDVFYLTYQGKLPEDVLKTAKALTDSYINAFAELSKSKAEYSYDFFKKQVTQLEEELNDKSDKLRKYEVRHASSLVDLLNLESGKTNVEIGPKMLLTQSLSQKQELQQKIDSLAARIGSLEDEAEKNKIPVIMPDMEGAGKTLSAYRIKVAQLQLQVNELKTKYTASYEPLRALQEELQMNITLLREEFSSLLKALKIEKQGLESQLEEVESNIASMEAVIADTAQERASYESLKQDFILAKEAYTNSVTHLEQARLATSLNQYKKSLTLVEEPQLPSSPVKPNRVLLCVMGLIGGMLLGVALALGRDYFDHTIKTPEDIERYLGVPCIGSISNVS